MIHIQSEQLETNAVRLCIGVVDASNFAGLSQRDFSRAQLGEIAASHELLHAGVG
jgi:hypothetical protein